MPVLIIRNEQLAAFEAARLRDMTARVLAALMRRYRQQSPACRELQARIAAQCRTAWHYGLRSAAAMADFVNLGLQLGPAFHEHQAVRAILSDPTIAGPDRMRILMQRLQPDDWRQVRAWLDSAHAA